MIWSGRALEALFVFKHRYPGGFIMRVLTTVPGKPGKFWGSRTTLADQYCNSVLFGKNGKVRQHALALAVVLKMLFIRHRFDVVVVDGGPIGQWYTWLQSLLFFGRKPTLMIDCLWYVDANHAVQFVKRLHKKLSARSVDRFLVWAEHEIEDYAREFGIQKSKFKYVPFHITLEDYNFDVRDEGFVFAGGNGDRDYRVLIEAVRGLNMPTFIATTDKNLLQNVDIPANVTVQGVSHEEFRERMASCRVAVVPMRGGLLHSGGQQTFLNSMYLGKPTVVVGSRVANGYVEDGVNGLVVDYGDAEALREALVTLWESSDLRRSLGLAAQETASTRTTVAFMQEIYAHAEDIWLNAVSSK